MKTKISNETTLKQYLLNALKQALNDTMEEFLTKLKDIIQEEVYNAYYGEWADQGMRTGQFKESWNNTVAYVTGNIVGASIEQDINVMQQDFDNEVHIDRENLAQIINTGIGYNFGWCQDRPYWDEFLMYIDTEGYNVFQQKCAKYGIQGSFV